MHYKYTIAGVEAPSKKYFQGEPMRCVCCCREEVSKPGMESNWRCLEVNGRPFYVYPRHFPPDTASRGRFKKAYHRIFERIHKELRRAGVGGMA